MSKPTLSKTIKLLQEISKQALTFDAELSTKIDQAIRDLEELDSSKADQIIDRAQKIADVLAPITKLIYEYFRDS